MPNFLAPHPKALILREDQGGHCRAKGVGTGDQIRSDGDNGETTGPDPHPHVGDALTNPFSCLYHPDPPTQAPRPTRERRPPAPPAPTRSLAPGTHAPYPILTHSRQSQPQIHPIQPRRRPNTPSLLPNPRSTTAHTEGSRGREERRASTNGVGTRHGHQGSGRTDSDLDPGSKVGGKRRAWALGPT